MSPESSGMPAAATTTAPSPGHRRARWWALVLIVFAAQIGFILAFGDRRPARSRPASPVTVLNLGQSESELLALNDPTLFALPNLRGVAGQAWARTPVITFKSYRWTEAPRLLPLSAENLGHTFGRFMQTNHFAGLAFETKPEPAHYLPTLPDLAAPAATNSTLQIGGDLAGRHWLNQPPLRTWTGMDLVTNTVVQALVNPDGSVFSATLLVPVGSGTNDQNAAAYALQTIREARFAPIDSTRLMLGTVMFEWYTEPPSP